MSSILNPPMGRILLTQVVEVSPTSVSLITRTAVGGTNDQRR